MNESNLSENKSYYLTQFCPLIKKKNVLNMFFFVCFFFTGKQYAKGVRKIYGLNFSLNEQLILSIFSEMIYTELLLK